MIAVQDNFGLTGQWRRLVAWWMQEPRLLHNFNTIYSRSGKMHRWRLFTYDQQIATGLEVKRRDARAASRAAKAEFLEKNPRFVAAKTVPENQPCTASS